MKLAIQGCSHGELDAIYASLLRTEATQSLQIDALLLCGDIQAVRNHSDLHALAVPAKYRQLGDFHAYYSGQKVAPILTLVIGGNHEASNHMHELYHGGWLAPNIYFLGAAGVVELNGLVISGISGIYKEKDYKKGRYEKLPYDAGTIRSCYHTREFDVVRLKAMQNQQQKMDIVLSHDWPNTIEQWGDTAGLIRKKPFFKEEIQTKTLGSPPLLELLQCLKPTFWFSAHLHVKFAALYNHARDAAVATADTMEAAPNKAASAQNANPEAIDIDLDSDLDEDETAKEQVHPSPTPQQGSEPVIVPASGQDTIAGSSSAGAAAATETASTATTTRFLALHKCLPNTPFLQIIDHPSPFDDQLESLKASTSYQQRVPPTLRFNRRWLAVTRVFDPHFSLQYRQPDLPSPSDPELLQRIEEEERWLDQHLASLNNVSSTRSGGKRKQDELEGSKIVVADENLEQQAQGDERDAEKGWLDINRVQHFVRTAPAPFEPGGLHPGQPSWYTNPQTEAFCQFVGIQNKINPRPNFAAPHLPPPPQHQQQQQQFSTRYETKAQARLTANGMEQTQADETVTDPNALAIDMDDFDNDDDEEINSDSECGEDHHQHRRETHAPQTRDGVLTLSDDEDELHARWKEGTG